MASVDKFCVICKSTKEKLNPFTEITLQKCQEILKIRKANGLKFASVILPTVVNDFECTHLQCYKQFTALMKKYKESANVEEPSSEPIPTTSGSAVSPGEDAAGTSMSEIQLTSQLSTSIEDPLSYDK